MTMDEMIDKTVTNSVDKDRRLEAYDDGSTRGRQGDPGETLRTAWTRASPMVSPNTDHDENTVRGDDSAGVRVGILDRLPKRGSENRPKPVTEAAASPYICEHIPLKAVELMTGVRDPLVRGYFDLAVAGGLGDGSCAAYRRDGERLKVLQIGLTPGGYPERN